MTTHSLTSTSALRILVKAMLLFLFFNLLVAAGNPIPVVGSISAYNHLFPGRVRLPYGEKPEFAYNLSLSSLEAMFAAHEISAPSREDEYRVWLLGDSAVWGYLLEPGETLSSLLNDAGLRTPTGVSMRFYNLGYPTISLTKDLLILDHALQYSPDLILWLVTLEAFPIDKQLESPIVQNNPGALRAIISEYALPLDRDHPALVTSDFWDRTLFGRRRALADILRLQLYGVLWAATGVDQYYPAVFDPPQKDLTDELSFHNLQPPVLNTRQLAMEVLNAGAKMAGDTPILVINEPIYISQGQNSDIRYNFFYPRWVYDQYRQLLAQTSQQAGWAYLDLWDLVPPGEFTNSAIHLSPTGELMLSQEIQRKVIEVVETGINR